MPGAQVTGDDPRVRVSYYAWPGERRLLVVLGNMTAEPASVRLSFGNLIPPGAAPAATNAETGEPLSLIHISEPTRLLSNSYAVFCLKKNKQQNTP